MGIIGVLVYSIGIAGCSNRDVGGACTDPPAAADPSTLCAFEAPLALAVDASFTAEETAAIDRAAAAWGIATGDRARASVVARPDHAAARDTAGGPVRVVRVAAREDAALLARVDELAGGYAGKGYNDGARVFLCVDRIASPTQLELVVVHELGHALGLAHVTDRNAVMFASVDGMNPCLRMTPAPTAVDLAELRVRRCP